MRINCHGAGAKIKRSAGGQHGGVRVWRQTGTRARRQRCRACKHEHARLRGEACEARSSAPSWRQRGSNHRTRDSCCSTRALRTWCYGNNWGDAAAWTGRRLLGGTVEAAMGPDKPFCWRREGTSSGRHGQTYDTRVQSKIHSLANLAAARATERCYGSINHACDTTNEASNPPGVVHR